MLTELKRNEPKCINTKMRSTFEQINKYLHGIECEKNENDKHKISIDWLRCYHFWGILFTWIKCLETTVECRWMNAENLLRFWSLDIEEGEREKIDKNEANSIKNVKEWQNQSEKTGSCESFEKSLTVCAVCARVFNEAMQRRQLTRWKCYTLDKPMVSVLLQRMKRDTGKCVQIKRNTLNKTVNK